MLGQWHELHVGEAEVLHVANQLVGGFPVAQPLAPGAQMHLINRNRLV